MKNKARDFALLHQEDQQHGDHSYIVHLYAVAALAVACVDTAVVIACLHDVVEDTDVTMADVEVEFGNFVASCVAILTDETGVARKESKLKTYAKMAGDCGDLQLALLVKAADRLANVRACVADKNVRLLGVCRSEHEVFRGAYTVKGCVMSCGVSWMD